MFHKNDQMTPVERQAALAKGAAVDRYPIAMAYELQAHALLGWTRREAVRSAPNLAEVQKKLYEVFGMDGVSVSYGLHGLAIRYGAVMSDPEQDTPAILEHPIKDIRDLSALDLDDIRLDNDPILKMRFEALKILQDEIGKECPCSVDFGGPFSYAASLVGVNQLLKGLIRYPEQVHKLMRFATDATKILAEPFLKEGAPASLGDPVASGSMITLSMYREFAAPYLKDLIQYFDRFAPQTTMLHICGDTTPMLEEIAGSGCGCFSIDNVVDLEEAKRRIGDKVALTGNVDPMEVMLRGTPDAVRAAVRKCFQKAWDTPKGFTINTGCDTPYGTPIENSLAFVDEARTCAKYPLDPSNFKD